MVGPGTIGLRICLLVVALVAVSGWTIASDSITHTLQFKHLTAEDGLSHSWVRAILQDRQGYMWIGTYAGLNRYDGYNFKVYNREKDKSQSLPNDTINCLFEDTRGQLWIGHGRGLSLYRATTDDFLNFSGEAHRERGAIFLEGLGTAVRSIAQEPSGELWLASDAGLTLFDPATRKIKKYAHDPENSYSLSSDDVRCVVRDSSGNLWLALSQGLNRLDPHTQQFTRYPRTGLPTDDLIQLAIDRYQNLWIGTAQGVCRLDLSRADRPEFECFKELPGVPHSLASDYARVIFADREGYIWIGTENGGLDRFDYDTGSFVHHRNDPNNPKSLNNDSVYSLCQDRTGALWIGTFAGGVNISRRNGDAILHFASIPGNPNSLSYNSITDFFEDEEGYVWICTDGGGLNRFDPRNRSFQRWTSRNSRLTRDAVLDVYQDGAQLLVGTWAGGMNVFDPRSNTFRAITTRNSSLPSDSIFEINKDHRGRLILGTHQRGLVVYDPASDKSQYYLPQGVGQADGLQLHRAADGDFLLGTESGLMVFRPSDDSVVSYRHNPGVPCSIAGDKVYSIIEMSDGTFLIGTDEGLDRFDKRSGQFEQVSADLPGREVRSMAKDADGQIWIGTNRGLCRYSPETGQVKVYSRGEGTLGNDYNRCASLTARDGAVYLGGLHNGFNVIYPRRMTENTMVPPVRITDFRIANRSVIPGPGSPLERPIDLTRQITLSYLQSSFSFELAALDYANPERNRYAFRLEGFDDWNEAGTQRSAIYTNVDPGTYIFRARASNGDGYWNEEGTSVVVQINPPVWGTGWFRMLTATLAVGVVLLIVRNSRKRRRVLELINQQLNEEIIHARIAEDKLREARDHLEQKVEERTVELTERANQLRILAGELTLTEQRERRRLAKLLHDHLQQLLVGAKFRIVSLGHSAGPSVRQAAREVEELLNESIEASRSLTAELSPPVLSEGGLTAGLEWLAQWMNQKHGLCVRLIAEEQVSPAAEDIAVLLFESVRELLFNVVKHARVNSVTVSLERVEEQTVRITVADQGAGFEQGSWQSARESGAFGLFSIRERLDLIGGRLEIDSRPGKGARLTLLAPLGHGGNGAKPAEQVPDPETAGSRLTA
jgi:ligand-binding sensor domain-containing protein/signal transduction histidine kinase